MQVGLERVEFAGTRTFPFAIDQLLPGGSVGVALHCALAPTQAASDTADAGPRSEQIMHLLVVPPGALREPPAGLLVLRSQAQLVGRLRLGSAKAVTVASHAALDGLAQVLPEVKSIRDLHRGGGAETGSLGVGPGAVSAYHLHPGVCGQPIRQGLSVSVRQQLQWCTSLAVDQHSAVVLAAPQREVVHPHHPWRYRRGIR
ncbi:hypothetical protein IFM12275_17710 [Nocardia sputorum]|nr:hypothetical protein IFM12275_17710 [Nocardia sputorum]